MQNMANADIRQYAFNHNVALWRVAEGMGISSGYLSQQMRKEMALEKKAEIKAIIDKIASKKEVIL